MALPDNTYNFPSGSINVLQPSSQHSKAVSDLLALSAEHYKPIKPTIPPILPRAGIKYTTAAQVEQALSEAEEISFNRGSRREDYGILPEIIVERIEYASVFSRNIFVHMDKSLRANETEMLKLLKNHPEILPFAAPSLQTKSFYIKALEQNHKIYDILPAKMQQDQDIINQYAKTALANPDSVKINRDGYTGRSCYIPEINPVCPSDKFATPELYKQEMLRALMGKGMTYVLENQGQDRDENYCYVGSSETCIIAIRNMAPHLDFEKLDMELFHEARETLLANAIPLETNPALRALIDKYGLHDFKQEYEEAAKINEKRPKTTRSPFLTWSERVDAQKQEQRQKIARGERLSTHPKMLKVEERAIDLKERMEKKPGGNFDREILSMLAEGPFDVVELYIDFEAYIKQVARLEVAAQNGELLQPIRANQGNAKQVLQETKERCEAFYKALSRQHHYYGGIYKDAKWFAQRDWEIEREHLTPKEKDFRCAQQLAFESPHGSTLVDREVLTHMRTSSPEEYAPHLDAKEYLDRRTAFLVTRTATAPREVETFKTMVSKSPEATAIVAAKLTELGVKDPSQWLETAESRFQFSNSTKPSINRDTDRDDPTLETGDIGRHQ